MSPDCPSLPYLPVFLESIGVQRYIVKVYQYKKIRCEWKKKNGNRNSDFGGEVEKIKVWIEFG